MGFRPPEEESNTESENGAIECYGYGKFYPNDDVYINEKNNFYDENYYILKLIHIEIFNYIIKD